MSKLTTELLNYENVVLKIIQEYLNKNRFFTIEKIIPHINVRLKEFSINLNYVGIREILKSLIKKKQILERSKLTKEEILDNENRERIFQFIHENPGVYFNTIAEELNLSNYILAWHLKILSKFNYIRSKQIDNHEVFFDVHIPSDNDYVLYFISKKKVKNIIEYLEKNQEGYSKTQISKNIGMHSTTVNKYLEKLENFGLVSKKSFSSKTLYFLNLAHFQNILKKFK